MKSRQLLPSLLLSGIALGTAWAVRGQFGHEHGAAWAGAIGCMTVLLLARRTDWRQYILSAGMAGGLGWGLGGIMSYGLVVGYARGTEFVNVYYGLLMLFVIGGLYGFMGGGLLGISLSVKKEGVRWNRLIVEMFTGAALAYFFIIEQFGWLMTPPRSELWASCFGIAVAMTWYMVRQNMYQALRVALLTCFGAGFGFAFGNFLQVTGNVLEIKFNMWNVMEYSLGFFGGVAMSYGVYTSAWEEKPAPRSANHWLLPVIVLSLLIPFIMWQQNATGESLTQRFATFPNAGAVNAVGYVVYAPYILFLLITGYWIRRFAQGGTKIEAGQKPLEQYYMVFFGLYIFLSLLITGAFMSLYRVEQYLYLVNYGLVLYFMPRVQPVFEARNADWKQYALNVFWFLIFVALLAIVLANSHEVDLKGANRRF